MMGGETRKVLEAIRRWPVVGPSWAGGFLVGLFSALAPDRAARRAARRERFVSDWRRSIRATIDQEGEGSLDEDEELWSLRQGLAGLSKARVAALLGNPPSAFYGESHSAAPAGAHWQADTWYYPADLKRCLALAIHFENGRVSQVQKVAGPVV